MLWHIAKDEPAATPPAPADAIEDIQPAAIDPATGPVLENPRKYKGTASKAPIHKIWLPRPNFHIYARNNRVYTELAVRGRAGGTSRVIVNKL